MKKQPLRCRLGFHEYHEKYVRTNEDGEHEYDTECFLCGHVVDQRFIVTEDGRYYYSDTKMPVWFWGLLECLCSFGLLFVMAAVVLLFLVILG